MSFHEGSSMNSINKRDDGTVYYSFADPSSRFSPPVRVTYQSDGTILVDKIEIGGKYVSTYSTYFANGTIRVETLGPNETRIQIEDYVPYSFEELWDIYPFNDYTETSDRYIETVNFDLESRIEGYRQVTMFTSDYALYWFDYLAGYDVLFAQVGWNHTLAQDVALVRGAANMQNKSWGTIITWTYEQAPYLDSGEAIYDQMRIAYEAGAKYAVVFNYAENMSGPYGTLQDEHFVALERFWNDVVNNPELKQGSIKGEAVLVLPNNYGWGMRRLDDKIWGLWEADEKSEQIWELSRNLLEQYGLGLDIVYDDSEFPLEGKYSQIFYWNQTT